MADPARWVRINNVFQRALERATSERAAFVRDACGADVSLLQEVESLLAAHAKAGSFLDAFRLHVASSDATQGGSADTYALLAGHRIAQHEIVGFVGAGGMGQVYRARDTKLGRDVAIKVLPASRFDDPGSRARLIREARSAATLNHPNICTVYEIGEAAGHMYIVMEFIEGHSLQALAAAGLPPDEVLRYSLELADALSHAHRRGIIHRDFKTANVIVTPEARAKVLDFGLAKRQGGDDAVETADYSLTAPGMIVGTVPYMPPEQLRGERSDARSDVWAFGVVLYEMAAGFLPFDGRSLFDLSSSILHDEPHAVPAHVPVSLKTVIERCLAKDAAMRYRDAVELRAALDEVMRGTAASPSTMSAARRRIAVLPFQNLSGAAEQDYLVDGTHEALITDLAGVSGLRVIARPSVMRYRNVTEPLSEIAAQLKADVVLTGSLMRAADRVRLTTQLVDPATEECLWAGRYDRPLADVFSVQTDVVAGIAKALGVRLSPPEQARLAGRRPIDPLAYEAYLKGRFHWYKFTREHYDTALSYFRQALDLDPTCALAYAGIANTWSARGDTGIVPAREALPNLRAAVSKALELDDSVAEVHEIAGNMRFLYEWDWQGAEAAFRRAIELNPNYADGHFFYSDFLITMHRGEEAEAEMARALELDPFNPFMQCFAGWHLIYRGRTGAAVSQLQAVLNVEPNFSSAHLGLWGALYRMRAFDQAVVAAAKFFSVIGDAETERAIVSGFADGGYMVAMRRAAGVLAERSRHRHVPAFRVARLYAHAGDPQPTLEWLETAFENRETPLIHLTVGWDWDQVRSDARFQQLLRRIGLPIEPAAVN